MLKKLLVLLLTLTTTLVIAQGSGSLTLSSVLNITGGSVKNDYPAVAIDSKDIVHYAWMADDAGKDAVHASFYAPNLSSTSGPISTGEGFEYEPDICVDAQDNTWVTWSAKRNNRWGIYIRKNTGQAWDKEFCITDKNAGNFHPRLVADKTNGVWVAWESRIQQPLAKIRPIPPVRSEIQYVHIGNDQSILFQSAIATPQSIQRHPAITRASNGDVWLAWDGYDHQNNDVYLKKISDVKSSIIQVTRHPAADYAPSIAVDRNNRVWICWMSDRVGENQWSQSRWVYLRCFDGKKFYEPMSEPLGKDLTKKGVEQSFEFPTLKIDAAERIWILGRPSQGFYAQYYQGNRWSEIKSLSNADNWGGRGQYIKADFDSKGDLWFTYRDIRKAHIQKFTGLAGAYLEPVLKPAAKESTYKSLEPMYKKLTYPKIGEYWVYFGDIHTQSWMSDGVGFPEEIYARGRDIYQLDFMALTDHEDFVGNRISPSEWAYMKNLTNSFNAPDYFVTLNAFEWTDARYPKGAGHKNVYFASDDPPYFYHSTGISSTSKGLFESIKPYGAIAIPHHIGWTGMDWENYDPVAEPVMEVVSAHGAYEYLNNSTIKYRGGIEGHFIQDGLKKGLPFGLIGGSDTHGLLWQHGISRIADSNRTGLAAVLCKDLTRESILDAIKHRRCYATSGEKIYVDFRVNGNLMGTTIARDTAPKIYIKVIGTKPLESVEIIRDNLTISTLSSRHSILETEYVDANLPAETHYYYIRVIQKDGTMAWSSPVWMKE